MCDVDGCSRESYCRGWCKMHYTRWERHGDPSIVLKPRNEDVVGMRFGMLKVEERTYGRFSSGKKRYMALCKCDCGGQAIVDVAALKRGSTSSCGCDKSRYAGMTGERSVAFKGYREIRGKTFSTIKRRAEKRGIDFDVELPYLWELYETQGRKCALSGLSVGFGKHNGETTASLDRINSRHGYVEGNVQWVHKDINLMKNVLSVDYFVEMCKLVASRA